MELPDHPELTAAWREIHSEMRRVVGESTYEIWLAPLKIESWDGTTLRLSAPAEMSTWVSDRFGRLVAHCAGAALGESTQVKIGFADGSEARTGRSLKSSPDLEPGPTAFNPRYTFNQFIIGAGNRLAHAAALAVAEQPGQAYNPLFLHAPPGLGKTHLLQAIGNYVLAFGGGATVRYTTVESFTNEFISALTSHSLGRFKHAYRNADVLLIDDVQFLASKVKTEEEFFHTFNALYETGRQLVLTCDRLPRQLVSVEERLRERFESGLVADLVPPDLCTRVAILRKRAQLDHIQIAEPGVLELIAGRVTTNVRALEGALIRVVALHSLTEQPIDLQLTATVLDTICPESRSLTIADIQQTVAAYYEVTTGELVSDGRAARITWPRHVAIHLAREHTTLSLQAIGRAFGGRNHATVKHACKRVADRLLADSTAGDQLGELDAKLSGRQDDRPS